MHAKDDPLGLVRMDTQGIAEKEAARQVARRVEMHDFEDGDVEVPVLARPTSAKFLRSKSGRQLPRIPSSS